MNDMRTKQWFVKIHYGKIPLGVKEVWSDTQQMASIYAHKQAVSMIETQVETQEETTRRIKTQELNHAQREYERLDDWLHEWPEYMDDTDEDRAQRRENHAKLERLASTVATLTDELTK